jgi:hypothetical protein
MDAGFSLTNRGSIGVFGALASLKGWKKADGKLLMLHVQIDLSRRRCVSTIATRTVAYANKMTETIHVNPRMSCVDIQLPKYFLIVRLVHIDTGAVAVTTTAPIDSMTRKRPAHAHSIHIATACRRASWTKISVKMNNKPDKPTKIKYGSTGTAMPAAWAKLRFHTETLQIIALQAMKRPNTV